jgi:hypothetical protein
MHLCVYASKPLSNSNASIYLSIYPGVHKNKVLSDFNIIDISNYSIDLDATRNSDIVQDIIHMLDTGYNNGNIDRDNNCDLDRDRIIYLYPTGGIYLSIYPSINNISIYQSINKSI